MVSIVKSLLVNLYMYYMYVLEYAYFAFAAVGQLIVLIVFIISVIIVICPCCICCGCVNKEGAIKGNVADLQYLEFNNLLFSTCTSKSYFEISQKLMTLRTITKLFAMIVMLCHVTPEH